MSARDDESAALNMAAQAVDLARRAGATEAEAWLTTGRASSVRVRGGEIDERVNGETSNLALRLFRGSRTAASSTTDLASAALERLASETVALADLADPDPYAGLPDVSASDLRPPTSDSFDLVDAALLDPDADLLLDLARRADAAARAVDPRLRSGEGATAASWAGRVTLFNSRGVAASYLATSCSLEVTAAADDADGKKREGWWYAADRHLAGMEDAEAVGRRAAERTLRQLGARPVPTQEAPVVWAPEAARELLTVLAQAASGDARYRGATFLIERESEPLASPLLTIVDDATLPGRLGSRPCDAEGVASQRTPLFAAGLFHGFLHDSYSARKAGRRSTGNAARSRFLGSTARIEVAPSNLVMAAGSATPAEIIGGVRRGLYLTDMLGFGETLTTGDFSRGAAGLWIKNGELAFPVGEINIAGTLPQMLASIDAVGNDVTFVGAAAAPTFRMANMVISGR